MARLLRVLRAEESGVRANQDPEHLHDLRVAVRRIRSVLDQVRDVFPRHATNHFYREFRWLGSVTGPTRDVDVFLEWLATELGSLSPQARAGTAALTAHLRQQQVALHHDLVGQLDSLRYGALMRGFDEFLRLPTTRRNTAPRNARRPLAEVVGECIAKAYRTVRKRGRKLDKGAVTAGHLHDLRIACKKLRYLFDLFGSIYDERSVRRTVKDLKRLQDILGEHNDCVIQHRTLQHYAERMAEHGNGDRDLMMGVGQLVEKIRRRQRKTRKKVSRRVETFLSPREERRLRQMLETDRP